MIPQFRSSDNYNSRSRCSRTLNHAHKSDAKIKYKYKVIVFDRELEFDIKGLIRIGETWKNYACVFMSG